jgi:protein ImuB
VSKRYVTIWFPYLLTDWVCRRKPELAGRPFVIAAPDHGKMIIIATNPEASSKGVRKGMAVADARVFIPNLHVFNHRPGLTERLLQQIAEWCIRYTPIVSVDLPAGLILDVSGCPHLWGGEQMYLTEISRRFTGMGYTTRMGMADTIGAAWALAHFGKNETVVGTGAQLDALLCLPPASLRPELSTTERLEKLGLRKISDIIHMPRPALRRRFGQAFLLRIDQALGNADEIIQPVIPLKAYQERLPSPEPIVTATGIVIALQYLLETMCKRLQLEEKGLRTAIFKGYRVDGKMESITVGTNRPSHSVQHLFKLFEFKIASLEPATGIELFVLEAGKVEPVTVIPGALWKKTNGLEDQPVAELLDRVAMRIGTNRIHRYLPAEHYWPERSFRPAVSLDEPMTINWKFEMPRPVQLLSDPEKIEVTAPIPDYPPMLFRYKGTLHKIIKADGPERIEQEWWLQQGQHRDYYSVEDEKGQRYWLFRSGHYSDQNYQWFIHGFFA